MGEERGESRIARQSALLPEGSPFSPGDTIVTRHTVHVLEVRAGDEQLLDRELDVWIRGGEVAMAGDPSRTIVANYFGGGYLVDNEHYELDLGTLADETGRPAGYYIANAHAGQLLLPPPGTQGGSGGSGGSNSYLNPDETPKICKELDAFAGFDSFSEALDYANVSGRLEEASLDHTEVPDQLGSVLCGGSGEPFYELDKPFVTDFSVTSYSNPYWTSEQQDACGTKMFETMHAEFTPTGNPYSQCICAADSSCANIARPRVLAAGCAGPFCDPFVDECDPFSVSDLSNCVAVDGIPDFGGEAPGVVVSQTISVLALPQQGDYGVRAIESVDISLSEHANFSFFQHGGLPCVPPWGTPDVEGAVALHPVEFADMWVHEMGHAMGLKHVSNPSAMMYGLIVDIPDPEVTCHDRSRLAILYPRASCSDDGLGWPCSCAYAEGTSIEGVECLPGE